MKDIKGYESFENIEKINKGWSNDIKYKIKTDDGKLLLLRLTDISFFEKKKKEFEIMKKLSEFDFSMSFPIDFGICNNGKKVYSLFTWCKGEDAIDRLPKLSIDEQYRLGLEAGRILKKIHKISPEKDIEEWSVHFNRKASEKIEKYMKCELSFDGDNRVIEYIEENRYLLDNRPQCFHHGDYHVGNMVISKDNVLSIIDFNRSDFGDPYEEFNRIVWSSSISPYFATGQINGYFDGNPPIIFFKLLALYIASNTLSSIYWSLNFGDREVNTMKNQASDVLRWFDDMRNPIPTWYIKNV